MCPENSSARAALLVIDVQRELFQKSIPIYAADRLLHTLCALIDQAHAADTPVFFVQHCNQKDLVNGSPGWQLHPALQPAGSDARVEKAHGSAFQNTGLAEALERSQVSTVIVTGLVTHGCVRATCLDAVKRGYRVVLVADGHSNYHRQAAALIDKWNQKLQEAGVEVIPASGIFSQEL